MRFILKAAFWLGLIAFFAPFGGTPKETSANLSIVGAYIGAQEAIADLSGFCTRAPQACDTGREFAIFAGERIGDGAAMAYQFVQGRMAPPDGETPTPPVATDIASLPGITPDPVTTGAVTIGAVGSLDVSRFGMPARPTAYQPPRPRAEAETMPATATAPEPAPIATPSALAVPTPAPRA
ncbi:hypothetical protein Sa4125_12130 [Aureimonas sp. SA4125]|uniref:DUF5330 domain-containing protein n=1 Tax=Aureimonas sp. SA4125 TaxID=2826993 RepID=UPI001CC4EC3F|nr:DUF5330 domain-containing protein [Aureimonas sp. SA4125]BDA83671.1 hypothetical protein Sa4125_12130 [Aureimonas sp. SA4125]